MEYNDILKLIAESPGKRSDTENAFAAAMITQTSFLLLKNLKAIRKALGDKNGQLTVPFKIKVDEEGHQITTETAQNVAAWSDKVTSSIPDGKQKDFKFESELD